MLCDIDREALINAEAALNARFGNDRVASCWVDVTKEETVNEVFSTASRMFGGLDICVSNAGIASASPIEDTSLALWNRNMDILSTGYFLISRASFQLFKAQGLGA